MPGSKKHPTTAPLRRDDRAEPDEDGAPSRIEVVHVEGPGSGAGSRGEGAAAGLTSLKAQLARLNEQAAAVEKSLDEQRRDREGALDRLAQATERCLHLEAQVTALEAETTSLATMLEAAKAESAELHEENEILHGRIAEATRDAEKFEGEVVVLRKRQFQEALKLTEQEAEASRLRTALARANQETTLAREELAQEREETSRASGEIEQLRQALATASDDNAKDRATARARIDLLDHALDDARAATAQAETRLEASHASMRRLREDIADAFARIGHSVPSVERLELPRIATIGSPASIAPVIEADGEPAPGSIPPPTYASVPPQVHAPVEAPRETTSTAPPPAETPPAETPPAARGPDALFASLDEPGDGAAAARELKDHPEWLVGAPPASLLAALQRIDYDADRAVFDLARHWEREPLCEALLETLQSEPDPKLREHAAWLLKHLAAPSSWKGIAEIALRDEESVQLRRWLLEALDRLAAGRALGWGELGELIATVAKHPDAALRDGVVGILVSLDRSDEKCRLLVAILRTDDDEVVLASAVDALAGALPMELDPGLVERLLGHPSPRVQRSVRGLIERAGQTNP